MNDKNIFDFDKFGENFQYKYPKNMPSGKVIGLIALIFIGIWFISSGLYTINADEVGIVTRFGKFQKETLPGLHFKIPFGIDKIYKIPVARVQKEEFGFRTLKSNIRTSYSSQNFSNESLMLTGDLNIAEIEWIIQYKIKNAYDFLFNVRNIRKNLRDVSQAVVREIVGDKSIDEVLTTGRSRIEYEVLAKMQEILDTYKTGIELITVKLQNVMPPDPVKPSFNEVNEAKQEKEQMINNALKEYNKIIPKAEGQAKQIIQEAEGYSIDKVNKAKGDAARFEKQLKAYSKAKDITEKRLYLESMKKIFITAGDKIIIDEDVKSILPLLNLEKK